MSCCKVLHGVITLPFLHQVCGAIQSMNAAVHILCDTIGQSNNPGPSFIDQLISYLLFMIANNNHSYLNRLFVSVHYRYNWINHESSKKRWKQKQINRHAWSVILPKSAVFWTYTYSRL